MSNYVIGTYLSGEKLTNLLVNSVIREINKETKNHKTNIQVVHQGNFIVVRGTTTHKSPINLSKLFISLYKDLFNQIRVLMVVDLIEYGLTITDDPIYIRKTFYKDTFIDKLTVKTTKDTLKGIDYRFTACTNLNLILTKNILGEECNEILKHFEDYKVISMKNNIETFSSSEKYGQNLRSSKVFEFYLNYIVYNIFQRNLCDELTIELFTESEFDLINWENLKLKVESKSLITSTEWLESLILDLFTFKPNDIISRWDLNNYDFENEILSTEKSIWEINDKVSEMILF